ncbi:MAG TPA: peroxiredoxin [Acidimicrobiales bacterium]|nr:peroxiredoxin [Acidimicrobiales bacterium]
MQRNDLVNDFTLLDQDGKPRTLSTMLLDGPVVLFFFPAALSPGCTKESCHFRDLKAEFDQLGAQPVGISMDSAERQAEFAQKYSFDYPLLADVDGDVARQFGVKRALNLLKVKRASFVIGQDRRVREIITSEVSMNAHADRALAALRA